MYTHTQALHAYTCYLPTCTQHRHVHAYVTNMYLDIMPESQVGVTQKSSSISALASLSLNLHRFQSCSELTCRTLRRASKMTITTLVSLTTKRSHRGLREPAWMTATFCCMFPPAVRLVIAQTASFCALYSPWTRWNRLLRMCYGHMDKQESKLKFTVTIASKAIGFMTLLSSVQLGFAAVCIEPVCACIYVPTWTTPKGTELALQGL